MSINLHRDMSQLKNDTSVVEHRVFHNESKRKNFSYMMKLFPFVYSQLCDLFKSINGNHDLLLLN